MYLDHVMLKEHGVTRVETATFGSVDLTLHGVLDHSAYEWKAAPSRSLRVATALHRTVRNACAPREYDSMFLHPREAGDASQRPTKLHHLQASDSGDRGKSSTTASPRALSIATDTRLLNALPM